MQVASVYWFRGTGRLSRLIMRVTKSRYSHVGIWVNDAFYEALGSGIVKRVDGDAYERIGKAVAVKHIGMDSDETEQAQRFLEAHIGRGYSVAGFIAAGAGTITRWRVIVALDGEYICSGFVATALAITGVLFDRDPRLMTPEGLAQALEPERMGDGR